jgi:hypothetical protein
MMSAEELYYLIDHAIGADLVRVVLSWIPYGGSRTYLYEHITLSLYYPHAGGVQFSAHTEAWKVTVDYKEILVLEGDPMDDLIWLKLKCVG